MFYVEQDGHNHGVPTYSVFEQSEVLAPFGGIARLAAGLLEWKARAIAAILNAESDPRG